MYIIVLNKSTMKNGPIMLIRYILLIIHLTIKQLIYYFDLRQLFNINNSNIIISIIK